MAAYTLDNMVVLYIPSWSRSKHRKDSERRAEHQRDKMDPGEDPRDAGRHRGDHWRKRDALETRCCYLCGSSTHIKKDCQLYRSPAGACSPQSHFNHVFRYCHTDLTCRSVSSSTELFPTGNVKMENYSSPSSVHMRNLREKERQVQHWACHLGGNKC